MKEEENRAAEGKKTDGKSQVPEIEAVMQKSQRADASSAMSEDKLSPQQEQMLTHNKKVYEREQSLFDFSLFAIMVSWGLAWVLAWNVFDAISDSKATPWLLSFASLCMLIPVVLLGCLLNHTFQKNERQGIDMGSIANHTPIMQALKALMDLIESGIKVIVKK